MRNTIRFIRNGNLIELDDFEPTTLLLDYLREVEGARGTKDGCSEGECGACTIALGRSRDGGVSYEPINACIQLLGMVDGTEIVTVEDLAEDNGKLHPVQEAMLAKHATQCGFCTPGFVMSLFTLYQASERAVTRQDVDDWLSGNLCRCTGYRPIIDAAMEACSKFRTDKFRRNADDTARLLAFLKDDQDVFVGDEEKFFAAPASIDSLADLYEAHPTATIVAGATDVGLWITKQMRDIPQVIHLGRVRGFNVIEDAGNELLIGAGATYADIEPWFKDIDPDLGGLLRRIGGKQVRASGTIGGNVATGSSNGDVSPVLIALSATVELRKGKAVRALPIEQFFIEDGKQDLESGEFVVGFLVPSLAKNQIFRAYKVAKRFDQDFSSVLGAFRFTVDDDGVITEARIVFGGMAETPKRAAGAEAALREKLLNDSRAWSKAFAALRSDFHPIDDHRASARYRTETAHALLGKALIEAAGTTSSRTRIVGLREGQGDGR